MTDGETLLTFAQWAGGDYRSTELIALLVTETDLVEAEAEAIVAYLADGNHDFTGKKSKWYSGEIADYYRDRLVEAYDSWGDVGQTWITRRGGEALLDILFTAARQVDNTTELHEIIAAVGKGVATSAVRDQWWYETGALADGRVVCMYRPGIGRGSVP